MGSYLIRHCAIERTSLLYDGISLARLLQFCEPHWWRIRWMNNFARSCSRVPSPLPLLFFLNSSYPYMTISDLHRWGMKMWKKNEWYLLSHFWLCLPTFIFYSGVAGIYIRKAHTYIHTSLLIQPWLLCLPLWLIWKVPFHL